jgi:FtsP/CotA-like multicopper oxidase with cupredoxin domain
MYDEEAFLQLDDWLDGLDGLPKGPVKDTFLPPPMQVSTIDMVGDNAGRWAFHCHNEYHADTGMLRVVSVD